MILVVALGLGWCADFLFYDKNIGVSVLIFVLLVLAALFGLSRLEKVKLAPRNWWLIIPLLFFSTMLLVRANATLTFFNLVAIFALLGLLIFFYAAGRIERLTLLDYPVVFAVTTKQMLTQAAPLVTAELQIALTQRARLRPLLRVVRGLVFAVPVLAVFTVLLASADTVFAKYVGDVAQMKFFNSLPDTIFQILLVLAVGWLTAGSLVFSYSRQQGSESGNGRTAVPGILSLHGRVGFVEAATILFLVDLLFVFFAWIQFTYLFTGKAARTMNYEVYRDYVRTGFGQLLVAAALTMFLILGLHWMSKLATPREKLGFNLLSTLMIGLAFVMLLSAFERAVTWENVQFYINTDTRLYIRAFMVWLALTFLWLGITLWRKPERFAIGFLIAILGWLVTVNVMNPDEDVARYNLTHYQQSEPDLSTRYLYLLSDDALPVLVDSLTKTTGAVQTNIRHELSYRLFVMENDPRRQNWQSFNVAHAQAYDMLERLKATGQIQ